MSKYLLILSTIVCGHAFADVPADQVDEVNHLIEYVKNSGCIINRNGTDHPADKGVNHIMRKYNYFRDDISSTEEFIEYSATKSTMSGKYYTATCKQEKPIKARDWLLAELERYRSKQKQESLPVR